MAGEESKWGVMMLVIGENRSLGIFRCLQVESLEKLLWLRDYKNRG